MKMLLTVDRVRAIVADALTEKDIEYSLRSHKVRYSYDTSAGFLAFRIPARSGTVLVYRTCSRSTPFRAIVAAPVPAGYPYKLPRFAWDD